VLGLLEELAREEEPGLGRVQMAVEVEDEVVRDDRVPGREERDEPVDEMALARQQSLGEVDEVVGKVDLLDRPGVADRVPVALVELGVAHRAQVEVEAGVEESPGAPGSLAA